MTLLDERLVLAILLGPPLAAAALTVALAAMPKGGREVTASVLAVLAVCFVPMGLT